MFIQFKFIALTMKSVFQILVIFLIAQTICCENYEELDGDKSDDLTDERESVFFEIYQLLDRVNIVGKCDKNEMMTIVSNLEVDGDIFTTKELNCSDSKVISKFNNRSSELKSYFTQCIDPNYIELVDRFYELDSKLLKFRCEMTDQDIKEMQEITGGRYDSDCRGEVLCHLYKCYFSEQEMIEISKNVSKSVHFVLNLINGNDKQCGIANRIEKCYIKSMIICESQTMSKHVEYYFNQFMKLFNCKVDKTVDITESTISEPLRNEDLYDTFKNATRNCNFEELQDLMKIPSYINSIMSSTDNTSISINIICELKKKDEYKSVISKSALTLAKCVDPNYINHIEKLKVVATNSVDVICEKSYDFFSIISLSMETIEKLEDDCLYKRLFQIHECEYSHVEIRELMDDRSLISNFTLELLDGNVNKCGVLNEIRMCVFDVLQKCDSSLISIILKSSFNILSDSLQCKRQRMSSGWKNTLSERTFYKEFIFEDFNEAFGFMTRVALYAAQIEYYPEFNNVNNKVKLVVTSDELANGFKLAKFVDEITI